MAQLNTAELPKLSQQEQDIIAAGGRAPYVARYTAPYVSTAGGATSSPQPGILDAGARRFVANAMIPGQVANAAAMAGLPVISASPEETAAPVPAPAPAPVTATLPTIGATGVAAAPAAVPEMSNLQKAQNYAYALGDTRPEVLGTRFHNAYAGLNAETAAQAAVTAAQAHALQAQTGKNVQLMTPHEIGQEQEIDPLTGMATRNRNIYGTYNPETKGWEPIQMPTIEKRPEPPANHVNALRANPALAAQFDAQYGVGAAKKVLGQ